MATFTEQQYISAMYVAGYDRAPDFEGYTFWQGQLAWPATPAAKGSNFQTVLLVTLLLQHSMAV